MLPVATSLRIIKTPRATYSIVAANVLIHFLISWHTNFIIPDGVARTFGFDPASFGNLSAILTLITSMFFHGDLLHLFGNMVFLLVFGRRVENQLEAANFLTFYFSHGDQCRSGSHAHGTEFFFTSYRGQWSHQLCLGAFFICNPRARISLVLPLPSSISYPRGHRNCISPRTFPMLTARQMAQMTLDFVPYSAPPRAVTRVRFDGRSEWYDKITVENTYVTSSVKGEGEASETKYSYVKKTRRPLHLRA
jgi:hypothetical protein